MIEICNGRVFVEGVETVDPTLIGYALLDFAENNDKSKIKIPTGILIDKSKLFEKYNLFKKQNNLRNTYERDILIKLLSEMDDEFTSIEFAKKGVCLNICHTTCYTFLRSIISSGIIEITQKTYSFDESLITEL